MRVLPKINIDIAGQNYDLYVASTNEEQKRGLSYVDHLSHNEGMIFPYDDDRPRTFQFRDTLIPLKVYFISRDGEIVQTSFSKPGQQSTITCNIPTRWVVEVLDGGDSYDLG
tara:strand:- start:304 stop:639 length:336 start_codon:yes stop_codon:yes gene_type:complete